MVLHDILRLEAKTTDTGTLISGIRDLLGRLMDTTNFFVALWDPVSETYRFPFFADQFDIADPGTSEALPKSLTDYVRRTGKPALVDQDRHAELVERGETEIIGPASHQWMGAPMVIGNRTIGVVALQTYDNPALYTMDDLDLLATVAGTISVAVDRKRNEEDLLWKSRVFEVGLTANSTADSGGVLNLVNRAFLKTWGYDHKDEVIGRPISDFLDSEPEAIAIILALDEVGQWEGEFTARKKDGATFHAQSKATVIKDARGEAMGYQSAVLDVSDRYLAEIELSHHRARLEREVTKRTADLQRAVDLMAGREVRMAELKKEVRALRERIAKYEGGIG